MKKDKKEEENQDIQHDSLLKMLEMAKDSSNAIPIVHQVLEETILQKAAEYLYNKYLTPKVRPYTACQTIELTLQQVNVSISSAHIPI